MIQLLEPQPGRACALRQTGGQNTGACRGDPIQEDGSTGEPELYRDHPADEEREEALVSGRGRSPGQNAVPQREQ